MASGSRPWCLYYIQGEPGETPEEPNAFMITSASGGPSSNVSLKQIMASMPLVKSGVYHFRFKVKDDRFGYAWQDTRDPNALVPVLNGVVYAKLLRLDQPPKPHSRLRRKPLVSGAEASTSRAPPRTSSSTNVGRYPSPQPTTSSPPLPPRGRSNTPPIPSNVTPTTTPSASDRRASSGSGANTPSERSRTPVPPSGGSSNNLFDSNDGVPSRPPPPPQQAASPPTSSSPAPPTPPKAAPPVQDLDDFLYGGAPAPAPTAVPTRSSTPPNPSPVRVNQSANRATPPVSGGTPGAVSPVPGGIMDIDDDTPSAPSRSGPGKSFLNMDIDDEAPPTQKGSPAPGNNNLGGRRSNTPSSNDLFQAFMDSKVPAQQSESKEEEAFEAAKSRLAPKLDQWASDGSGKLRNVRTLISTMHTVLWEGNTWKPVFLGDLMQPDRVKFHYRKAMLVLHPDKNVKGSVDQRVIAERIFTAVNEAYKTFETAELK